MRVITLSPSQLCWLPRALGRTIECRQGSLWLSHAGQDVVLHAGESWHFQPGRETRALVQSMAGAAFVCQR